MIRCDPRAYSRCETLQYCGECAADCCFTEGSECDKFNRAVLSQPMTNADRIRAMTDEELAKILEDKCFCHCPPLAGGCEWPGSCRTCWLEWLQQPARENDDA